MGVIWLMQGPDCIASDVKIKCLRMKDIVTRSNLAVQAQNLLRIRSNDMAKEKLYRVRDAKNGQFLPKGTEKRRPATTVKETIKKK